MAADWFVVLTGGRLKRKQAVDTSAGAADAGKIPALNADGKIDPSMVDGLEVSTRTTSEALSARDCVSLHDSTGVKVRKATNTAYTSRGVGFVKTASGSSGLDTPVFFEGIVSGFTGLTIDADYYLGVNGAIVLEAGLPTTVGQIVQKVGRAISTTELMIEIEEPIEL